MKYSKGDLSFQNGITKEWLLTNGIGGFSSSTIIGANTRRYHGLLLASLMPPGRRFLVLSKLDESVEVKGEQFNLYTNICSNNYIADGFKYEESFEKEYIPVFTYKVGDIEIKKHICMEYGKNSVCVLYKVKNGKNPSKLTLAPIINYRDFHTMNTNHEFSLKQDVNGRKVKIVIDNNPETPIYIHNSCGKYIEHYNDTFRHMYYQEEEKRGFYPEENHSVPGRYEIELKAKEEKDITFICSLEENIEEIDGNSVIANEIKRLQKIVSNSKVLDKEKLDNLDSKDQFIKDLLIATDQFVVNRPSFGLHSLIAGYPWFLDWGRDSLIAYEGCLLVTKRYDIAREILLLMVRDIKFGLVPNGYSGFDSRPLYNSVDASLLLFEQVHKYIQYTGDTKFIKENIYVYLRKIIDQYKKGIDLDDNNIYLDKDGLIVSGTAYTQNTWMDAKYEGFAVTPRNGKAVEINSLWYNSLKIMEGLAEKFQTKKEASKYAALADKCKQSFEQSFYNPKKKCLYDVIGDSKIRPNQLFSLSLSHPVIELDSKIAKEILNTVEKKLLNKYGLKTLAKGEDGYVETYEGDSFRRDMSYHQGITWPWLLGLYYDALKNVIKVEKNKETKKELETKLQKFTEDTEKTFIKSLYHDRCIGSISEIYDSKTPWKADGTIAQGWSVSEVLRIVLKNKER